MREPTPALDTTLALETPEGGEIVLRPAGLLSRGLALLVDELIRWSIVGFLSISLGMLGDFGLGLFLLALFATYWCYGVAFEVLGGGATPGKRMQQLMVVHDDGTPVRLPASVLRNLVLIVDLLPIGGVCGAIAMMSSGHFRRLGDLAAGTLVVYREPTSLRARADEDGVRAAPVQLSPAEQRAFTSFLERVESFSAPRARELAEILTPLIGAHGDDAVREVRRIAAGLEGAR